MYHYHYVAIIMHPLEHFGGCTLSLDHMSKNINKWSPSGVAGICVGRLALAL